VGVSPEDQALAAAALVEGLQADAPIGFAVHDEQLRFELVSDSLAAINGRPAAEHLGRRVTEILPPALAAPVESVLPTPDRVVVATLEQVAAYASKSGKREWVAAADIANGAFSREKDMRVGATSLDAKGRWLVVGGSGSLTIIELATGQQKDQIHPEAVPTLSKPAGKAYPFGKSFASVALSPEGILWGLPGDAGMKWTLLR